MLRNFAELAWNFVRSVPRYFGVFPRTCSICGYEGKFLAFGDPPRWDAACRKCRSLERHRLMKLLLDRKPGLVKGRLVHFAPERAVTPMLKDRADEYVTADLMKKADLALNLENIDLPDDSVDTIVCSHVLEHVDDRKALAEIKRCLTSDGVALLAVPIIEGWQSSYENSAIKDDKGRLLHFGQGDHVRYYGSDFRERVKEAGFELEEFHATGEECVKYGLIQGEAIFVAKPNAA